VLRRAVSVWNFIRINVHPPRAFLALFGSFQFHFDYT
jgi:hypothetical protein